MGRLLAALRRIESRGDTTGVVVATDAPVEPRAAESLGAFPGSEQESSDWPGTIDHDLELEYPSHWPPPTEDWPAIPTTTAPFEPLWPPALPSEPGVILDHAAALLAECDAESPVSTVANTLPSTGEETVADVSAPMIPMQQVMVNAPLPSVQPLAVEVQKDAATAQTNAPAPEAALDEPLMTVRMPGFGRPNRAGQAPEHLTSAQGFRRPALRSAHNTVVPFLPPSQRPYREACENILAALPEGRSVAVVLAWSDDDLDHCLMVARLAEIMADRLDDPVLLIDVGPQRRLSTLLRAPADGTLIHALAGFVSWRDQIVQTGTAGLCLLPSAPGDFHSDPVAVARLIEGCKDDFAIVLIGGGALPAIPENVLTACDAAVLLVEAGHTAATTAAGAVERLRRSGTDVIGCLLTATAD